MTTAANDLQYKRFLAQWWWLDPARAKAKCEAALAWETLRRTGFYPAVWRTFINETIPQMKDAGKPSMSGVLQQGRLISAARGAVGQPYFDFLMRSFDPGLTWLELREDQRLEAQGFVLGETVAIKANGESLLPRQKPVLPAVALAVAELGLDNEGHVVLSKQMGHGFALGRVAHLDLFRRLALQPGRYVSVFFDTRGTREALLEAFDKKLEVWGGTAAESWTPEFRSSKNREKRSEIYANRSEVAVIPTDDPGFAILLVSARHNPASVRGTLHYHLKPGPFRQWHSRCVDYWKTVTVESSEVVKNPDGTFVGDERGFPLRRPVVHHLFDPEKHLPPEKKAGNSARRSDLWFGLAANDLVVSGLPLGKTSAEGAFLYGLAESYPSLRNHQRSAALRLRELDQGAKSLHEALARQTSENAALAKIGFFKVAAGEPGPGASA